MAPELIKLCREYEQKFPRVPNSWSHYKQYALPDYFRDSLETVWSFGVSKEIRFEEAIKKHNANAKIYTWDPTPLSLQVVKRSTANPIHTNKAYDPPERVMKFYTTDPQKKCWSLENIDPDNVVDTIEVQTENLSSIVKRLGNNVDLIKLDIEGRWFELCNEILDLNEPVKMVHVECEMYFGEAEKEFSKLDSLVDKFKSQGFKVWTIRIRDNALIELCFDKIL